MKHLHKIDINIADIQIRITSPLSDNELKISEIFKNYFGRQGNPAYQIALQWHESASATTPQGRLLYDPGDFFQIYRTDVHDYIKLTGEYSEQSPRSTALLKVNSTWDDLVLIENQSGVEWESMLNNYAGELILRTAILFATGLLFHASCLDDNGRGIVFLGHSGVGKSTQLALWSEEPDVIAINDDRIAVRFTDHGPYCFGIPWCGSSAVTRKRKVPVTAIIILEQALDNKIEKLSPSIAASQMAACAFLPYWDKLLMKQALSNLNQIIRNVPVYRLQCRPEKSVIPLVRAVL